MKKTTLTRTLRIADPCSMRWESMAEEGSARHCDSCKKKVHDLSSMTAREAAELLASAAAETLCVSVEHEHGAIRYKAGAIGPRAVMTIAVGASLIATSCKPAETPSIAPRPTGDEVTAPIVSPTPVSLPSAEPVEPEPSTDRSNAASPDRPPPKGSSPAGRATTLDAAPNARDVHPRDTRNGLTPKAQPNGTGPQRTTGCVCIPSDPICDCL